MLSCLQDIVELIFIIFIIFIVFNSKVRQVYGFKEEAGGIEDTTWSGRLELWHEADDRDAQNSW